MAASAEVPDELRERAVMMRFRVPAREGKVTGRLALVARHWGFPGAVRSWVKQAAIYGGVRPGTTPDYKRVRGAGEENRELRRANEILKLLAPLFAREPRPELPR